MRKIKLYITASIDGFIAPPDGDLEWLIGYPVPSKEDHKNFLDSVDTVIIGGETYSNFICMDILWPYKGKTVYVVARNPLMEREDVNFITENAVETISELKKGNGKDIWLVGGAELISLLLGNDLIDEMIITYISETLEKGIPLFTNELKEKDWVLKDETAYDNKAVRKIYQFVI